MRRRKQQPRFSLPLTIARTTVAKKWREFWNQFDTLTWLLFGLLLTFCWRIPTTDPDFGWHLRSGLDLLKNFFVPKFDPYSYTLPDWPWVNHEWLADGLAALIYKAGGIWGLSLVFAILLIGIFLLAASATKKVKNRYKILAGLVAILAASPILGVRMQMITLLGMVWLLWILYRYRIGEIKHLWWLPVIFLFWANLHGGFLMGFVVLGIFWLVEGIKFIVKQYRLKWYKWLKIDEASLGGPKLKHLLLISGLSFLATFINPYGWGLYYDFYKLFTNPFAIKNISEWQPVSLASTLSANFTLYMILFAVLLLLTYRKVEPTRWAITGSFLWLSFLYWRNLPFFMVMSVGFLAETIQEHTHLIFDYIARQRWILVSWVIIVGIIVSQQIISISDRIQYPTIGLQAAGYPVEAVKWIQQNRGELGDKMFNEYDWGGYLIWKLPEYKVFLDGRMPYWQIGDRFPFVDHQYAMSAQAGSIEMLENKYGVDWFLIRQGRPLAVALYGQTEKWKEVYRDGAAVIYRKII